MFNKKPQLTLKVNEETISGAFGVTKERFEELAEIGAKTEFKGTKSDYLNKIMQEFKPQNINELAFVCFQTSQVLAMKESDIRLELLKKMLQLEGMGKRSIFDQPEHKHEKVIN